MGNWAIFARVGELPSKYGQFTTKKCGKRCPDVHSPAALASQSGFASSSPRPLQRTAHSVLRVLEPEGFCYSDMHVLSEPAGQSHDPRASCLPAAQVCHSAEGPEGPELGAARRRGLGAALAAGVRPRGRPESQQPALGCVARGSRLFGDAFCDVESGYSVPSSFGVSANSLDCKKVYTSQNPEANRFSFFHYQRWLPGEVLVHASVALAVLGLTDAEWAGVRGNPVLALEQPWRSHGLNTLVRALIASLAVAFVVPAPRPSHSVRVNH